MVAQEIKDITISAVVLAFVFAYEGFSSLGSMIITLPASLLAVSLGFILHELGHRQLAKLYNCHAEYRLWKQGLFFALLLALITNGAFTFAALGAVVIFPRADLWGNVTRLSKKAIGHISVSGPLINLALALCFAATNALFPFWVFSLAAQVNSWLALFNLLPVPPLDGSKVFVWDKRIWSIMLVISVILLFVI